MGNECPVCGGARYKCWSGLDEEGAQVEPAEVHCPDCGFAWQQCDSGNTAPRPSDVEAYRDAIKDMAEDTRAMLKVWDRVTREEQASTPAAGPPDPAPEDGWEPPPRPWRTGLPAEEPEKDKENEDGAPLRD